VRARPTPLSYGCGSRPDYHFRPPPYSGLLRIDIFPDPVATLSFIDNTSAALAGDSLVGPDERRDFAVVILPVFLGTASATSLDSEVTNNRMDHKEISSKGGKTSASKLAGWLLRWSVVLHSFPMVSRHKDSRQHLLTRWWNWRNLKGIDGCSQILWKNRWAS
jgi:hypothetical protein